MNLLTSLFLRTISIFIAAYIIPGVDVGTGSRGLLTAAIVAIVLGVLNQFLRPLLLVLTLPINILTLGLFTLVVNTFLILLAASIVPGFSVSGFLPALLFGLAISLISSFLSAMNR